MYAGYSKRYERRYEDGLLNEHLRMSHLGIMLSLMCILRKTEKNRLLDRGEMAVKRQGMDGPAG